MDLYSVVPVSDRVVALEWFWVFFGRPADEVMGRVPVGRWARTRGSSWTTGRWWSGRVGKAMTTLGRPTWTRRSPGSPHGISHEPVETYANGVRHVVVLDPDGNSLSLAQGPA